LLWPRFIATFKPMPPRQRLAWPERHEAFGARQSTVHQFTAAHCCSPNQALT
jgi:hypothetical protein